MGDLRLRGAATEDDTNFGTVSGPRRHPSPDRGRGSGDSCRSTEVVPGRRRLPAASQTPISKADPTWASAVIRFVGPNRIRCATTGTPVIHRGATGWQMVAVANGLMSCTAAPPGVVRSLFGSCRIVGAR